MKTGYSEAAWRLFQPSLNVRPTPNGVLPVRAPGDRTAPADVLSWADTELAGTPFGRPGFPIPIVRTRGNH
jgi:hypothetical protein